MVDVFLLRANRTNCEAYTYNVIEFCFRQINLLPRRQPLVEFLVEVVQALLLDRCVPGLGDRWRQAEDTQGERRFGHKRECCRILDKRCEIFVEFDPLRMFSGGYASSEWFMRIYLANMLLEASHAEATEYKPDLQGSETSTQR